MSLLLIGGARDVGRVLLLKWQKVDNSNRVRGKQSSMVWIMPGITEQLNCRTFKTMTMKSYRRPLNNDKISRL